MEKYSILLHGSKQPILFIHMKIVHGATETSGNTSNPNPQTLSEYVSLGESHTKSESDLDVFKLPFHRLQL